MKISKVTIGHFQPNLGPNRGFSSLLIYLCTKFLRILMFNIKCDLPSFNKPGITIFSRKIYCQICNVRIDSSVKFISKTKKCKWVKISRKLKKCFANTALSLKKASSYVRSVVFNESKLVICSHF